MWRNAGLILLAILAAVAGVGFVLPARTHVAQSTTINAPPQVVFQTLNSVKEFNAWSPWMKKDRGATITFAGPDTGEGASMSWQSAKIGNGTMTIMSSMPAHIDVALEFAGHGAKSWYDLVPDGSGTKLTWGFESQPYGLAIWDRYFGAVVIGPETKKAYKVGLADLKIYVETKHGVPQAQAAPSRASSEAASEPQVEVKGEIETLNAKPVILAKGDAAGSSIDAAVAAAYARVDAFIAAQKLTAAGPAIAITRSYDDASSHWVFEAGVPVAAMPDKAPAAGDGVAVGRTYSGRVARFKYHGRSDGTEPTYRAIAAWLKAKSLQVNGDSWEEYLSDEKTPKDDWDINIYFPVK